MWDTTLRQLHEIRKELMSGLGNIEMRQAIWEKHYWRAGDEERDQKLAFEEVERLCKRLNVSSSSEELERLFKVVILLSFLYQALTIFFLASRYAEEELPRL
jgi:phosphatidylinositol phospholipase C, delta